MAHRKEDKMFFSLDLHEQIVVALGINLHHQSGDLTVNTDFNVMTAIDKWGKDKSYNVTYLLNKKQFWEITELVGAKQIHIEFGSWGKLWRVGITSRNLSRPVEIWTETNKLR